MGHYLRYLACHPEGPVQHCLSGNTAHLCWMYEHYALPLPSEGISKVNIYLVDLREMAQPPSAVLGIATVAEWFDVKQFAALTEVGQQHYYLDRLHAALLRCAGAFGWDAEALEDARSQMLADRLEFSFHWKRPLTSPDREHKAQGWIEASERTRLWLRILDRTGDEVARLLLAELAAGSIDPAHVFGRVEWLDPATVRVTMKNGRDYWMCRLDGSVVFHYPPAVNGDPHGEFALGRMYCESGLLPPDPERGLPLIRSAAAKGFKHAQAWLRRNEEAGGASPILPP